MTDETMAILVLIAVFLMIVFPTNYAFNKITRKKFDGSEVDTEDKILKRLTYELKGSAGVRFLLNTLVDYVNFLEIELKGRLQAEACSFEAKLLEKFYELAYDIKVTGHKIAETEFLGMEELLVLQSKIRDYQKELDFIEKSLNLPDEVRGKRYSTIESRAQEEIERVELLVKNYKERVCANDFK